MCLMDTLQVDQTKTDAFLERMLGVLNGAAITLMISIGHRTGLFDTMAKLPASSSAEIAAAAGLQERYVREWLAAMVTGRIVNYDPDAATYQLPHEHAAALTRAASPNNLGAVAQFIPVLANVEDQLVQCFETGGGVPYSAFQRFQQVMADESDQTVVSALMDSILPLAPGVIEDLERGIDVADVGCGSGHAINALARRFPHSRFVGYEISKEGIAAGRAEAERLGLSNARFEIRDAAVLYEPGRFGLITAFDAIHDQARPDKVLAAIARSLRPDGTFLMQDIAGSSRLQNNLDHPLAPFFYTVSCMHCMTVSLAQNGAGLGTMWGREKAEEMLSDAGFKHVVVEQLPHDIQNLYYIARLQSAN